MGVYATVAELRADPNVGNADPPSDATLEGYIGDVEDLVDRLIGPRALVTTGTAIGRKYDPAGLSDVKVDALRRATVALAVELVKSPAAFDPPRAQSVSGPDFSMTNLAGLAPASTKAVIRAAAILDGANLRVTRAVLGRSSLLPVV